MVPGDNSAHVPRARLASGRLAVLRALSLPYVKHMIKAHD
jgi:hypothetical protein